METTIQGVVFGLNFRAKPPMFVGRPVFLVWGGGGVKAWACFFEDPCT